jgi:hypothetical protein
MAYVKKTIIGEYDGEKGTIDIELEKNGVEKDMHVEFTNEVPVLNMESVNIPIHKRLILDFGLNREKKSSTKKRTLSNHLVSKTQRKRKQKTVRNRKR